MTAPVFYYAAAGAAALGGIGTSTYLWQRGNRAAAAQLEVQDRAAVARALREEINLEGLRQEARAAGVDPEVVEQGYRNLRDGQITFEQAYDYLRPKLARE